MTPCPLRADDVNVTTSTNDGLNLDGFAGTTVSIAPGVTANNTNATANCSSSTSVCASTRAWTLTNQGTIGPNPTGNGVRFSLGGALINSGAVSNANISITGGAGSVTNQAGATITSTANGISIATSGAQFLGTVGNAGTITGTGSGDLVALFGGGTVTNLSTGTISANNSSNAVSISGGTLRTVTNSGIITNTGPSFATGVLIQGAGATNTVTNNLGAQISGGFNGIFTSSTAVLTLNNAGSIASTRGSAVEATLGGTFTNSGTIGSTNSNGILTRNTAAAEVINSGTITGAVNAINFTNAGGGAAGAVHTVRLQTGSILNGNVLGGTGTDDLILEGTGSESIAKFANFETLSMQGSAWTLSGAGAFTAGATVQSGDLEVNGTLTGPALIVNLGATLSGTGTIAGTVTNNGNIAPGNSIGTMNIAGPYTQATGSTYTVELDSTGASDLIDVTGSAAIQSGAAVRVLAAPGTYTVGTRSTILTASTGVAGTYDTLTDNAPFVDFMLNYDANNVFLDVLRSSVQFSEVAQTPNQTAAATALGTVDAASPVVIAALSLGAQSAPGAFDQLSGEIYASDKGLLLNQSADIRDAINDRALASFDGAPDQIGAAQLTLNLAPQEIADCSTLTCAIGDHPVLTGWGRAFGNWGSTDGDGNAAAATRETGGFLAGVDATFQHKWRIGVAAGYGHTSMDVDSRNSTASADSYHLALYGGLRQGSFSARLGAGYSFHDIDAERDIDFAGFMDSTHADYSARTAQVFGEVSNDFRFGRGVISPFAGLAYVNLDTDGFTERGGAAALHAEGRNSGLGYSSLGLRGATSIDAWGRPLDLHGMVGWRHALGDVTPETTLSFDSGSAPFTVSGVPIARDSALIELGADLDLTDRLTLGLSYSGQIAADAREHGVRGEIRLSF
jgi:outer membrane autotransporter protein